MEFTVHVEKPSNTTRKLTIKVPAQTVASRYEKGLAEVQKTAKLKGFREGQVPISIVKQYYGDDVRHRLFHTLIEESYRLAVRDQKIQAVGSPQIETPDHKTGAGAHDHSIGEGQDLTFTATVEVLPEIEVKGYTGVARTREKAEIGDADVDKVIANLRDSQAQLVPPAGGLVMADGSSSSRAVRKGDFVDMAFSGGVVTDKGVEERDGMKGSRMLEVGSDALIPGFEDELVGMRAGETKTFRVPFPKDFHEGGLAGKDAEFTVTINEVKEKKVPELDDDFAKQLGYESVADMRVKAKEHLLREREQEVERKLRSDLLQALIEKNPFEVPMSLIQAQTRALAQDVAQNLKQQGFADQMIQETLTAELDGLKKRAENQVRATLILEAIAKKESIAVTAEDVDSEISKMAEQMKVDLDKVRDYYTQQPQRRDDLEFRMREDRTVRFLLEKSKVKNAK
jgi:trigger factor